MSRHHLRILGVVVAGALTLSACGDATSSAPADAPTTTAAPSTSLAADASDASDRAAELASTYEAFGNPDAEVVIVNTQGGPATILDNASLRDALELVDTDEAYVVNVHQAQTLDADRFVADDLTFDEAKAADQESVEMLAAVVEHFVDEGKTVHVLGVSFGAFMAQELLATQGNIAAGYLIMVGRLDIPDELWTVFADGDTAGFERGTDVVPVPIEEAGMGAGSAAGDRNMARLAAGLGHHRYTDRLADVALDNVVYAYGATDEQVGGLLPAEVDFLVAAGATVLESPGGHDRGVDDNIVEGLSLLGIELASADDAVASGDDILTDNDIGSVMLDGVATPVDAMAFEDPAALGLDEASTGVALTELALVAAADDILLVAPLSASGEDATGTIVVTDADDVWVGTGFAFSDADGFVVAEGVVTSTDGVEADLSVQLGFGLGSSTFAIDGNEATITGDLGARTLDQVEYLIAHHPEVDTLVLQQINGSVNDEVNVQTAALVREAGFVTRVPADGEIFSGGVDLFAAGTERIAAPGATVGVHAWCCGPEGESAHELPQDHPGHDDQLALFTSLMGDEAGRAFYFYTLQAAPFDGIAEMSPTELDLFDVVSADDALTTATPADVSAWSVAGADLGAAVEATIGTLTADGGSAETLVVVDADATAVLRVVDAAGAEAFWRVTFVEQAGSWSAASATVQLPILG